MGLMYVWVMQGDCHMDVVNLRSLPELQNVHGVVGHLVEDLVGGSRVGDWPGDYSVPIDVYDTSKALIVKADLPGFGYEDVEISIEDDVLAIKGDLGKNEIGGGQKYYHRELRRGSFCRRVPVPFSVNSDQAEAELENGVLTITLPKADEARLRKIEIKAK